MSQHYSILKFYLLFILFLGLISTLNAQEPCGTTELLEEQLKNDPDMQKRMDEMDKQVKMYMANPQLLNDDLVTIPVVVHVIYHTEAENISDAQIYSQLEVLNEDFRRLNADTINTPAIFKDRAANINLKFVLAKRDPNGNASCGVTRTYTDSTEFHSYSNMKYNSSGGHDQWPTKDYLNIWVCRLRTGLYGFATGPGGYDPVDGIVVVPRVFGRGNEFDLISYLSRGRVATHEVGHWLRLKHIWGDGNCNIDDEISDTPVADGSSSFYNTCTFPDRNSCNYIEYDGIDQPDMIQNYMDYSFSCMNLFTEDQKTLMRVAFGPLGARSTLRSSLGATSTLGNELTLNIQFDGNAEEVSWDIINKSTNDTVSSSNGVAGEQSRESNLNLPDGDYTFNIYDGYEDGICCGSGNGNYLLKSKLDTLHISNGMYGAGESFDFNLNNQHFRFVGPGTDWYEAANWNHAVPLTLGCQEYKILIESNCIKTDGIEIKPPNVLLIKHGVTFSATVSP